MSSETQTVANLARLGVKSSKPLAEWSYDELQRAIDAPLGEAARVATTDEELDAIFGRASHGRAPFSDPGGCGCMHCQHRRRVNELRKQAVGVGR